MIGHFRPFVERVVLGAFAFVCASPGITLAQASPAPPIGPPHVGSSASYRVAWTTTADGSKVASVSSVVTMRWRAGTKIVASIADSDQPASVYVLTRANDGTLALDNAANVDATGARLVQVLATLDALVALVTAPPDGASTWTKTIGIPVQSSSSAANPPQATTDVALAVTRSLGAEGTSVTASGSSTRELAASPAPAPMRLLSRIIRQKPVESTTSCTIEERYARDGSLIAASLEEKTITSTGRQAGTVVTSWHIAPTP